MATAVPRSSYNPSNPYNNVSSTPDGILKWMTWEVKNDPSYKLDTSMFHVDNGQVVENQPNFLLRNPWLIPTIATGAGLGIALAAGAGGAAAAGGEAGAVGTSGSEAAAAGGTAAATGGTAGTGVLASTPLAQSFATLPAVTSSLAGLSTAGGGSTSILGQLIPSIIQGATQIFGASTQAGANVQAAQIQAQEYDKALAQTKQLYEEQQARLAPYQQFGQGGLGILGYLSGIAPSSSASTPTATTPTTPQVTAPSFPSLVSAGQQQINMKDALNQNLNRAQQAALQYGLAIPGLTQTQIDNLKAAGIDVTQPLNQRQHDVLFGPTSIPPQWAQDQYQQQLSTPAPQGYTKIKDINGNVSLVPSNQVQSAIAAGGTQV